jgi:hypothetical protein
MKLSELNGGTEANVWGLPYPSSELAEPQITPDEARAAETAICRWHKGMIAHSPIESDVEGKTFFCPIGRQYWRYTKQISGFVKPLAYTWRP